MVLFLSYKCWWEYSKIWNTGKQGMMDHSITIRARDPNEFYTSWSQSSALPHSYQDWDKFDPFEFDNGFRRWKSGWIGWEDLMFEWLSRDAVVLVALFRHHPTSDLQNLVEIYSFKDFVFKVLGFVDFVCLVFIFYYYFLFNKKIMSFWV